MTRTIQNAACTGLLAIAVLLPASVAAQCILANPSFEIAGSGSVFGGWNEFGVVGSSPTGTHGAAAARVTGPNLGGWDVSGYWQEFDTSPGEQWRARVCAWHTVANPLVGSSQAILNVEWRDGGGNLISYESHAVANAATPLDEVQAFSVVSGPAPSGTVKTRILLGVLQAPGTPVPDVYYDQAEFDNVGPPSLEDIQWNDFPGGRTLNFSGRSWRVKGPGFYGPGPNSFSDGAGQVWVDGSDRLHMTVENVGGVWYSTEITLEEALGYGDYIFTTVGRVDNLDPNIVLGLFLWQYGPCWDPSYLWWNPFNEIDIEFSRWGNPGNDPAQFVAQPFDWGGNINRFDVTFTDGEIASHAFRWLPDRIEYRSWRGGPADESAPNMIHSWTYTGPHIPRPEQPRVHINLWQFGGPPAANQEIVLDAFTFVPECVGPHCDSPSAARETSVPTHLATARPNPFNPSTTIEYTLFAAGHATIVVYDVAGRPVRTLVDDDVTAGRHPVTWDGRDDSGARVASGVYLYQLRSGEVVETRKMVLLK